MPTAGERRSAADVLAKAKAKTERVRLLLDGDLLDQHEQLTAESKADEGNVELADRLVALEAEMRDAEVEFVFKGMGRGRWRALAAEHPPSDEHKAQGDNFDSDVFPFEAMSRCLDEPRMTVEELKELHDRSLSELQYQKLWFGCLAANLGGSVTRPESRAAHATRANGRHKSAQLSESESAEVS